MLRKFKLQTYCKLLTLHCMNVLFQSRPYPVCGKFVGFYPVSLEIPAVNLYTVLEMQWYLKALSTLEFVVSFLEIGVGWGRGEHLFERGVACFKFWLMGGVQI